MTITAIIFGSLGTLTETSALHRQAFNETFSEEGLDWQWDEPTYRGLLDHVGGVNRILTYAASHSDQQPMGPNRAAELHKRKTERYAKLVRSAALELRPGVERLLTEAKAAGLKRGLATGTSLDNIEVSLDATGNRITLDDFDAYTVRDMIERPKPARDAHSRCVEMLGVDPAEAFAIEDSTDGVASAVGAGLAVVATPGLFVNEQDFGQANLVLSSLGDSDKAGQRLDGEPGPNSGIATLEWLTSTLGL